MKQLVAFQLDNGSVIVVETDEPETEGAVRASRAKEGFEVAKQSFNDALEKIHSATESAITKLRNLSEKPDEVTMEFGFNFSAEFGAIIARATTDANYKVTLNWKRNKEELNNKS